MPQINQKDLSFYDTTSFKLDTLVPSSREVLNLCTDNSVGLIEYCTTNTVSSSNERIATIISNYFRKI